MKRTLVASFLSLFSVAAYGATINAASPARADVVIAVAAAVTGDTVAIPAGSVSWTNYLATSKAITLQGAGVGQTIIAVSRPSSSVILEFDLVTANAPTRMTGIEFTTGTSPGGYVVTVFGGGFGGSGYTQATDTRSMRIDHCKFNHVPGTPAAINCNDTIGVIDHNEFLLAPGKIGVYTFNKNWSKQGPYAVASHSEASAFGTDKFLFIEDNTFTVDAPGYAIHDCYGGARVVFRNNVVNRGWFEVHGMESGRWRGGRAFEVYSNLWTGANNSGVMVNFRSGIGYVYGNVTSNSSISSIGLENYRQAYQSWYEDYSSSASKSGGSTGQNVWDVNDTSDYTGNGLNGSTNGQVARYTGSGANDTDSSHSFLPRFYVSGVNWTINQFKGMSVLKTNLGPQHATEQFASEVFYNGTNSITFFHALHGSDMQFTNGEPFLIKRCVQAFDACGRARGSKLSSSGSSPALPPGWNDQVTEPCYQWNNVKLEGGVINFSSVTSTIRQNEHYFDATPAPGYTAYVYPHPLTGAVVPVPPTPSAIGAPPPAVLPRRTTGVELDKMKHDFETALSNLAVAFGTIKQLWNRDFANATAVEQ